MKLGANYLRNGHCEFLVWALFAKELAVVLQTGSSEEHVFPMEQDRKGYWTASLQGILPGSLYRYRLGEDAERPDPASHSQPMGVHGPSQVVDHTAYAWGDQGWKGIPLPEMIIYEVHIGTFTPEGTFEAALSRLDDLREVGINVIEIMPVGQFPGERNWGYDGAFPFAVQNSYGGPQGLKRFVDGCHQKGIGVVLDVVYNHLGPEGNFLGEFAPYFTNRYRTPWGEAVNFDGPHSNEVRRYFIDNAFHWFSNYHIDVLRLDAVHAILDFSGRSFLSELSERVEERSRRLGRTYFLIAESDLNDTRLVRPREAGGHGMDAQWCDDFHHSLHAVVTGERRGYYADFGKVRHLVKSIEEGFVYSGQYSRFRKRNHGNSSKDIPANRFVVYSQNHDQIGNRMLGERLSSLLSFESLKLAAGILFLSPYIPLIFMGEEYGESAPFLYFVHHSDPDLIESVRRGRRKEFASFHFAEDPPDPQAEGTFRRSKIDWKKRASGNHRSLVNYYRELVHLRKKIPALSNLSKDHLRVRSLGRQKLLFMERWKDESRVFCFCNLGPEERVVEGSVPEGRWRRIVDSSEKRWNGPGPTLPESLPSEGKITVRGYSVAVYLQEGIP